jgi:uncharacterized membrane protein YhiD involved in acid resistance
MNYTDIALAIIKDTGAGIAWITLGFFATIVALAAIAAVRRTQSAAETQADRQRAHDLDLVKSQLARLVDEQRDISSAQKQIAERVTRRHTRKSAVIEAEAS